ncbi:pyridoxamine 5'-phosphate oxidase family protein [Natronorubrum bangense]|uniref:Pyridoxamine 5'-phosphate oxidase-related FMN-binding protein n=2 Tax=Natronorubrum bangense TaxID=61858 RepID=L9WIF9_9EURY|nr:pyridoxamine 5'-phosphate oxidase family protein [Natronorubrum bangense]ELY49239.1 pyridoxamine 5'-phosphate oxidase-related FMN- binding protein [Natronorubrum bangense JCM 10635]QCC57020.1 pyridoxamine 5'-phosphate oxidase family protein [Natronorubrum bangense]
MHDQIGYSLSTAEAIAFLEQRGNGTLSLANENRAYGLPISYGYDEAYDRIVIEFVSTDSSKKEQFASTSEEVTLSTYDFQDQTTWASVIVTGSIHRIPPEKVSNRVAALFFSRADDAAGDVRWMDKETFDKSWYEIEIETLSGRRGENVPTQEN